MKLEKALYGANDKFIDISDKMNIIFERNVTIPKNININQLFGDPIPNVQKYILLQINNKEYKFYENGCFLIEDFVPNNIIESDIPIKTSGPKIKHIVNSKKRYVDDIMKYIPNFSYEIIKTSGDISNCDLIHIHTIYSEEYKFDDNLLDKLSMSSVFKILTVHDYQYLFPYESIIIYRNMYIKSEKPKQSDIDKCQKLFSLCNKIIFPTKEIYDYYSPYISVDSYVIEGNMDINESNYLKPYIPIIDDEINICILGTICSTNGSDIVRDIVNKVSDLNFINIGSQVSNYIPDLSLVPRTTNIFSLLRVKNIHAFWFPNGLYDAWSYDLSVALATGLPIFCGNNFSSRLINKEYTYTDESNLPDLFSKFKIMLFSSENSQKSNYDINDEIIPSDLYSEYLC